MHYTHFPQPNDIYSNSPFQRKHRLVWKNVVSFAVLCVTCDTCKDSVVTLLDHEWIVVIAGQKGPEFVDRLLKKQKF